MIEYTRGVEDILAKQLPQATVAHCGPRYQSLKEIMTDLNRVWQALQAAVRDKRADDPHAVFQHLIALAGQATKSADDVAAAANTPKAVSSVNVETTMAVLVDD